jgi:hypothetical protein
VDPLELAALRLVVGELASEDLPVLAVDALVRGVDSPSLRELAGERPGADPRGAMDLFQAALEELGIEPPAEHDALWQLAKHAAEQIVNGELAPFDGASWIWRHVSRRIEAEGDLRVFVGLASEWEDHPEYRSSIEATIVEEARILVGRDEPRRWLTVRACRGCSPLWYSRPDRAINIQSQELPIQAGLAQEITQWAADFNSTFDDDPAFSGFITAEAAVTFVERGRRIVARLQEALGTSWHVEYMPEPVAAPGLRLRARSS